MAQPLKPAMHKVHEHGGVLRPAPVATPYGNAVGAGQPMVIGPAKAIGPAHSQHAAMCKMDQQPLPLPCEVAPSVMSMTGNIVRGSIRPASVSHANEASSHFELRPHAGHSAVWKTQCHPHAALQPAHATPLGVVISGPATSNHSVHTPRVAPLRSSTATSTAPPKSEAVQHTQSESRAHMLTTQQLAVSSHSSTSNYVDITPLLARRPGRGRGKAVHVAPIPGCKNT
jgi:hypothetical protein